MQKIVHVYTFSWNIAPMKEACNKIISNEQPIAINHTENLNFYNSIYLNFSILFVVYNTAQICIEMFKLIWSNWNSYRVIDIQSLLVSTLSSLNF